MRKEVIIAFIIVLLSLAIVSPVNYDRKVIDQCKKDCRADRALSKQECVDSFKECRLVCTDSGCKRECYKEAKICRNDANAEFKSCKNYCSNGLVDFSIEQEQCEAGGGLFSPLCNGPYFGLVCSQQRFCICNGSAEHSCPSDYVCQTDFNIPNRKAHNVEGWMTSNGLPLGDIGLCAKEEII